MKKQQIIYRKTTDTQFMNYAFWQFWSLLDIIFLSIWALLIYHKMTLSVAMVVFNNIRWHLLNIFYECWWNLRKSHVHIVTHHKMKSVSNVVMIVWARKAEQNTLEHSYGLSICFYWWNHQKLKSNTQKTKVIAWKSKFYL